MGIIKSHNKVFDAISNTDSDKGLKCSVGQEVAGEASRNLIDKVVRSVAQCWIFVVDDFTKMLQSSGFWCGDPFGSLWCDAIDGAGEFGNGVLVLLYIQKWN